MTGKCMPDTVLTVDEVAHLLNVHAGTVRWWTDLSTLPCYRIESKGYLALGVAGGSESDQRSALPLVRIGGIRRG